jgi:hypothetical protein
MRLFDETHPITAIIYSDGPDFERLLKTTTGAMAAKGVQIAGLIQESRPGEGRRRCDIYLRDLATDEVYGVSEDRGPHARGCMLDTDRLLRAGEAAQRSLAAHTEMLILCKFGKTEASGGGLRSLIVAALELSVPVLIGVPEANLEPFRAFAAGLACEIPMSEFAAA